MVMDLETKDERESELNKDLEVSAKLQLEEWYAKYNERISSVKAENRKRDAEIREEVYDESLDWQKVALLCGFKSSKNVKDASRMRSVIMNLSESGSRPKATTAE